MKIRNTLFVLVGVFVTGTAFAESETSHMKKEAINASIDRRLGWLQESAFVPAAEELQTTRSRLPNRFAWQSDRFMQGGPPPYAQQPENLNEISILAALLSGKVSGLSLNEQVKIFQSIASNPSVRSVLVSAGSNSQGTSGSLTISGSTTANSGTLIISGDSSAGFSKTGSGSLTLNGGGNITPGSLTTSGGSFTWTIDTAGSITIVP